MLVRKIYCKPVKHLSMNIILDVWTGGGGGWGLSLESRVKFPYIHESRNSLEQLLVTLNV